MKKIPKKNISLVLADIKNPNKKLEYQPANLCYKNFVFKKAAVEKPRKIPVISAKRQNKINFPRIIFASLTVAILALGVLGSFIFLNFGNLKSDISARIGSIGNNFEQAIGALGDFNTQEASILLDENNFQLTAIENYFQSFHLTKILNFGGIFGKFMDSNQSALVISQNLEILKTNGFNLFLKGDGQKLVETIKNLQNGIGNIRQNINSIRNQISSINGKTAFIGGNLLGLNQINDIFSNKYLDYSSKIYKSEDILASLLGILEPKNDVHWLILFQNPAEIRPAGGFLGSYADLTINSGRLANIDVRDIYDPDGQLDLKIIPPLQLQTITVNWGARDANWFFDFPLSARKIINLLEASKIYQEKNIQFGGAVALNVRILESLMELTGPIKLPDYPELNKDNILQEIQNEVEGGLDKTKGEPKRILKVLTPVLLEKINDFNEKQKADMMEKLNFHLTRKDIMFFAKDQKLQGFFSQNNFAGEVYKLPENFYGSYLAVVNANIAGGKSDFFIKQEIEIRINLENDGKTTTQLDIKRSHNGGTQKASWWKTTNKDFIKIFASPESHLLEINGNSQKIIKPLIDYQKENYQKDPEIQTMEENQQFSEDLNIWTGKESDKTVWATWFNVPAGETKTLELKYETPVNADFSLNPGQIYQFILDKQSGVDAKLKAVIEAPPGYKWEENQSYIYEYRNDNPPGRLIINLTLSKI